MGCALADPPPLRGRRARSPCPVLGPTLGVMSLDAPAQCFRVFVFVPLQKSSPAPAHPTSPPLKATTEFLFKRPETSSQNDIILFRFGGALGPFCLPKCHQNRTKVGKKLVKNRSWIPAPFFGGFMAALVSKMEHGRSGLQDGAPDLQFSLKNRLFTTIQLKRAFSI